MATRRDRWRFFLEHAGYSVPPGRAACALELAKAEELLERAEELELYTSEVVHDDEPYDPGDVCTEEQAARYFEDGRWTGPFGVIVRAADELGAPSASLWGVVVGPAGEDDPYLRVVRAELADELEDELRQAIGDERDSRRPLEGVL